MTGAWILEHHETQGEAEVRKFLRGSRIRFQQETEVVPGIRVDFLIEGLLVVEVDGPHHIQRAKRERDQRRDAQLKAAGYSVHRIPTWKLRNPADRRDAFRELKRLAEQARHEAACRACPFSPEQLAQLMAFKRQLQR